MGILIVGAVSLGIVREAFGNGFIHGIGLVLLISSLFSIFNFRLWFWSYRSLYIVSITFAALSLLYAGVIIYQSNNGSFPFQVGRPAFEKSSFPVSMNTMVLNVSKVRYPLALAFAA